MVNSHEEKWHILFLYLYVYTLSHTEMVGTLYSPVMYILIRAGRVFKSKLEKVFH